MRGVFLTWALWGAGSALAQQPVGSEGPYDLSPLPYDVAPEPAPRWALSYQGDWWWVPYGPLATGLVDVAVDPDRPTTVAAITRYDDVWISLDGGLVWTQIMVGSRPAAGEIGDSRLDPQRVIEDVLSDVDLEAVGDYESYDDNEDLEDAAAQIQQVMDELNEAAVSQSFDDDADATGSRAGARSRVWFVAGGLYVGRSDGFYVTWDAGGRIDRLLAEPARALVPTPRGLVVGTPSGFRYSGDGRTFFALEDGAEGVDVLALASGADGSLVAGTSDGLWSSADGLNWAQRYAFDEPVSAVAWDPDVPGRLWAGLPGTLLSSDDGGRSFREPLSAPMPAVTSLVHLGALHWVAASADGTWETMNGGLSWVPIVRGLTDPATWALQAVGGELWLAADEGVFRMEAAPAMVFDPDAQAERYRQAMSSWIPRDALIRSATQRAELTARPGGSRLAAALLPRVMIRGEARIRDRLQYRSGLSNTVTELDQRAGTFRDFDRFYALTLELRWSPPGRGGSGFSDSFADASEADFGVSLEGFDEITGDDGVRRGARVYAGEIAARVGELYTARADAVQRRDTIARAPMLQQVQLELHIAELEAQLDALSNGAVTRWNQTANAP